jgi:hypothetical protein
VLQIFITNGLTGRLNFLNGKKMENSQG